MPRTQNEGFIIYIKFFLSQTLQCRIWSGSDIDSDEKARYQDIRKGSLSSVEIPVKP